MIGSRLLFFVTIFIGLVYADLKVEREFEVKQGSLLNNGRSYTILETGKLTGKDDPRRFTISNEVLNLGKTLVLSENGRALYRLKHKLGNLYQKWKIYDATTDATVATLKHRPSLLRDSYKLKSSKFGNYRISGNFGNREFTVKKDGKKVAEVHKKRFHLHDTYTVKIGANQDPALMLLLTIGIDEIREH